MSMSSYPNGGYVYPAEEVLKAFWRAGYSKERGQHLLDPLADFEEFETFVEDFWPTGFPKPEVIEFNYEDDIDTEILERGVVYFVWGREDLFVSVLRKSGEKLRSVLGKTPEEAYWSKWG